MPPSILLPKDLDERAIIEQWLRGKRGGQKVVLQVPKRGPKRDLVEMAAENAASTLTTLQAQWQADTNRQTEALAQLQEALGLPAPPSRIECFDISTLQGTNTVGSMVVFAKGAPEKGDYRRFTVKGRGAQGEPDDYAAMREVLRRRFRRAVEDAMADPGSKARKSDAAWKLLPDLLIVDGGKGQLGVAVEVLAEFGLTEVVPVVGLAKQHEELFLPGRPDGLLLPRGAPGPVPGPAHPRRGAPLRHHVPPPEARQASGGLAAGSRARHRPGAPQGAAEALRLAGGDPPGLHRGAGGSAGHEPGGSAESAGESVTWH